MKRSHADQTSKDFQLQLQYLVLPTDILYIIFSFVPNEDLRYTVPLLCKLFGSSHSDNIYYMNLSRTRPWISFIEKTLTNSCPIRSPLWRQLFYILNKHTPPPNWFQKQTSFNPNSIVTRDFPELILGDVEPQVQAQLLWFQKQIQATFSKAQDDEKEGNFTLLGFNGKVIEFTVMGNSIGNYIAFQVTYKHFPDRITISSLSRYLGCHKAIFFSEAEFDEIVEQTLRNFYPEYSDTSIDPWFIISSLAVNFLNIHTLQSPSPPASPPLSPQQSPQRSPRRSPQQSPQRSPQRPPQYSFQPSVLTTRIPAPSGTYDQNTRYQYNIRYNLQLHEHHVHAPVYQQQVQQNDTHHHFHENYNNSQNLYHSQLDNSHQYQNIHYNHVRPRQYSYAQPYPYLYRQQNFHGNSYTRYHPRPNQYHYQSNLYQPHHHFHENYNNSQNPYHQNYRQYYPQNYHPYHHSQYHQYYHHRHHHHQHHQY